MYNYSEIESKWRQYWEKEETIKTSDDISKEKFYILDMFPYPSGAGLHVGHPKGYIATDVIARRKMMEGKNVLHPMGWDAFGLPAENYALKNKVHPKVATDLNIEVFKEQLQKIGLSYDWSREINTTDPEYYKWTQWSFLKMFERGLVYESFEPIIWCPSCKTGLAMEDLEDGQCERCGSDVERKPMRQWVIKITDYAEKLLAGLDDLPHWEEAIKEMQRHWIGKSFGAEIDMPIIGSKQKLKVFTTRPDTLFGCSYAVLAPEHVLITELKDKIENFSEVEAYINLAKKKSDLQRTDLNKDKSGVELKGLKVENPANGESLPIFVADYVLANYGTGAIMCVPAHDERDFEFAHKYELAIKPVVEGGGPGEVYTEYGEVVNSDFLDGLDSLEAKDKMISWLEKKTIGQKKINYRLNDWVFSRQRYWGEPIPIIHCDKCGAVAVPEDQLPVKLPEVDNYEPSGTGESPLANIADWVNTLCPKCGGAAKRETNTMPQWAGSSWYYLRYMDPKNNEFLVSPDKEKYFAPVDVYVGGAEHATRHLIYARFWHKFLFDIGVVSTPEPFEKLQHVGLILAEDGRKMSKRWGNVINPDDIIAQYGADALRVYEMFMGPFGQSVSWNTNGVSGAKKFLDRVWDLKDNLSFTSSDVSKNILHKTIKKVSEDIDNFRFNTAVSAMMIFINDVTDLSKEDYGAFIRLLAPLAPHISEEIWQILGNETSIFKSSWPIFDANLAKDNEVEIVVQVCGKLRAKMTVKADISEDDAFALAKENEAVVKWIENKDIKRVVFVPGKLLNIVAI